jgi:hypothetical protein
MEVKMVIQFGEESKKEIQQQLNNGITVKEIVEQANFILF